MKTISINSVPSSDIPSQQELLTEKNPSTSNEEVNDQGINKSQNLNHYSEALESAQNQKERMTLPISEYENTSTKSLPDSSLSSYEQTIHIPNINTGQEIIDEPKEVNNSELPPPKKDNIVQNEINNMELDSSKFMNFEYGQILQQPNSNITNSIWNSQINNNVDNLSGNIDQNFDREYRYKFRSRHSPNSRIGNEKSDNDNNKAPFSLRKLTDAEFQALPSGSRLFLGNLSTQSISKKELYDIFSPYGEVFQISIKNSFGLEVSHGKPHRLSPNQDTGFKTNSGHRHEKRWNQRGGNKNNWHNSKREYSPARGHHTQNHNDWNYNKESNEREYRHDSYREEYRDQRASHRSKPYKVPNRDYLEQKQSRDNRSQSQDKTNEEFPLPRRQGNEVPECQIIALEEVDREANISVHTLHLSRKLQIQAVVRQMIVEGVHAVIFLERVLAINGKVNMQIFEHQRFQDNVKYDEYNSIKIEEAVGLLLRARVSSVSVNIRPLDNILMGGQQILSQTQQAAPVTEQSNAANINPNSLNNVNFAALANLLGSLQQKQPTGPQNVHSIQGIQPMQLVPPNTNLQHQPGFIPVQQQNFDIQQILRHLAPANTSNQQPYMQVPPHNLTQQSTTYNTSMINQPHVVNPNVMLPNTLPLSQHQSQHVAPNLQQFSNQIPGSSNVSDLMAQFNNYNNQC
nr:13525_t:CDS:2 [Entrophospora candida]